MSGKVTLKHVNIYINCLKVDLHRMPTDKISMNLNIVHCTTFYSNYNLETDYSEYDQ